MKNYLLTILLGTIFGISAIFGQSIVSLEASRAQNIGVQNVNAQGVYPVRLRWQKPTDEIQRSYEVYRSAQANSGFEKIAGESDIKAEGDLFVFIDANSAAFPGKPYYYRVMVVNSTDEALPVSEIVIGYGALSHERYLLEFNKTIVSSHKKLTLMNKPAALNKLGEEEIKGNISGTLFYSAKVAGLGGRVIMQYTQYADSNNINNNRTVGPMFIFTGNTNTTANMSQNGKMDGTVNVSGMYPGRIYFDNIQIRSGTAGGGNYGVEPQGFPRVELDWKVAAQ